jgi:hypothetical protein
MNHPVERRASRSSKPKHRIAHAGRIDTGFDIESLNR